jgi:Mg2+ and Co2+ transporters
LIEAKQLSGMTQINAQVLQQLSSTYNNILNNNLNDNMTTLTIVSILLATLAVITGFFGMNVPLPLTNERNAWWIIIIIAIVVWFLYAAILRFITRNR